MSRILLVLLAVVFVVSFMWSCSETAEEPAGGGGTPEVENNPEETPEEPPEEAPEKAPEETPGESMETTPDVPEEDPGDK